MLGDLQQESGGDQDDLTLGGGQSRLQCLGKPSVSLLHMLTQGGAPGFGDLDPLRPPIVLIGTSQHALGTSHAERVPHIAVAGLLG